MKINLTSSEPMPGDEPGTRFVKEPRAIFEAAARLKDVKVPILDENGEPTGKFVENIRVETRLVGDADVPGDKLISINYGALEKREGDAVIQEAINIESVYFTDTPRYAAQRADSMPKNDDNPEPAAGEVDTYEDVARAYVEKIASDLPSEAREKLKGLSIREQIKAIELERALSPPEEPSREGQAPPATGEREKPGNAPVLPVPTNTNSLGKKGPDTGLPYEELLSKETGRPVRAYDPRMLFGRDRDTYKIPGASK